MTMDSSSAIAAPKAEIIDDVQHEKEACVLKDWG